MATKIQEYFTSDQFREDMKKVGPNTPPYGQATPTKEILKEIIKSFEKSAPQSRQ